MLLGKWLRRMQSDRRAVTAIEYALLASLMTAGIFGAAASIGGGVSNSFKAVESAFPASSATAASTTSSPTTSSNSTGNTTTGTGGTSASSINNRHPKRRPSRHKFLG
ncbi:MAG: hypothetical protein B7X08_00550 [Acidocella sp. 20-63-7]|nr:MAG: hypothetical protein B7X08_00550 [Acidocella sp. 20-63-7]HQT45604.1 Flp family type IVb pilin [Acidocella sp.]